MEKNDKLDFINIKVLLHKGPCQEDQKTTYSLGENICNKELESRIYKEASKLNSKKSSHPISK